MAVTVEMRFQVSQNYVALFGRAPDAGGLDYWVAEMANGTTIEQIAQAMYDTAPARAYYPSSATNEEIVTSFYVNVLGRAPDAQGLAYWTGRLNASDEGAVIREMIDAVVGYNGTDPAALDSQALFNNKVNVAEYWGFDLRGGVEGSAEVLAGVTADSDTSSDAAIQEIVDDALGADTATLTTDVDNVVLGADGVVNAPRDYYPGGQVLVNTLQTEDSIMVEGGGGTLNATLVELGWVEGGDPDREYIGPNLVQGIDTVNVDLLGGDIELDLQDDPNMDIDRVALNKVRDGGDAAFTNLQDNVGELRVADTGAQGMGDVDFLFENNFEDMGDKAIDLELDDISMDTLTIMDDDGTGFGDLNIDVQDDASLSGFVAYATDMMTQMAGDFYVGWYEDNGNIDTMTFEGEGDLWMGDTGWNQSLFDASTLDGDVYVDAYRMLQVEWTDANEDGNYADDNEAATILTAEGDDWVDGSDVNRSFDGAEIQTAGGDDLVEIGNFWGYYGSGWGSGDVGDNTLIDTGTGDDVVLIGGTLLTDPLDGGDDLTPDTQILTHSGMDEVMIGYGMQEGTEVSTGTEDDVVSVSGWMYDYENDGYDVGDFYSSYSGAMDGTIDLGAGDDEAYIGYVGYTGTAIGGAGSDEINVYDDMDGTIYGDNADGTGEGNDVVRIDDSVEGWTYDEDTDTWTAEALVDTGAGNDTVWVGDWVAGTITTGAGDDTVEIGKDIWGDVGEDDGVLEGTVDLGTGNDTVVFWTEQWDGNSEIVLEEATLAGGEGDDTMIVNAFYDNDFWIDGSEDYDGDGHDDVDDRITGIEHLEVNYLGKDIDWRFVDLGAFDSALVDITLNNDAGWLDNEGDYYNVDGEAFFLSSWEHTAWWDAEDDDNEVDFTLNVTGADVSGDDDTLAVTLDATLDSDYAEDEYWDFDVSIDDETFEEGDDAFYENLALNIADGNSHAIYTNNDFGGQTAAAGGTDTDDGMITVTGGAEGATIELWDTSAATVMADIAANVVIDLDEDQNHDLTTGSGNDFIYAAGLDTAWDEVTEFDAIDMGAGRDRLIVSDANQALGDTLTGSDEDFANKHGIEELQVLGDPLNTSIDIMLDDDAYDTDIDTLILTEYEGYSSDAIVRVGDDFERNLAVVMEEDSTIEITNESSNGLLAYDISFDLTQTDDDDNGYQSIWLDGADANNVDVAIEIGSHDKMGVSDSSNELWSYTDLVNIDINDPTGNDLDSLVFTEETPPGLTGLYEESGSGFAIEVSLSETWRDSGTLVIDAGAIGDNDVAWDGDEWVYEPNPDTGGIYIHQGEDDVAYAIDVTGTANSDEVYGTNQDDIMVMGAGHDYMFGGDGDDMLSGEAGMDTAYGGLGNDELSGGADDDMLYGEDGDDVIDGGDGDDWIVGGIGDDVLTGGAGDDTFVFGADVPTNGLETITDFESGTENDVLDLTGVYGGVTLLNTVTDGAITLYKSAGTGGLSTNPIDLSGGIAVVSTLALTAEDNATVAGWLLDGTTAGVFITGNTGSDELLVWYVNDNNDGIIGDITGNDVALAGLITLTQGDITSLVDSNLAYV